MVRQNKSDGMSNVQTRASLSFNARQNNSVLVNASAHFVEPLIFTNIKVLVAQFYKRDYKTFTNFRLFLILCSCTTCSKGTCSWSSVLIYGTFNASSICFSCSHCLCFV